MSGLVPNLGRALDVLVVDDHPERLKDWCDSIRADGGGIRIADNEIDAARAIRGRVPDVIVLDLILNDQLDGALWLLGWIDREPVDIPIVVVSDLANDARTQARLAPFASIRNCVAPEAHALQRVMFELVVVRGGAQIHEPTNTEAPAPSSPVAPATMVGRGARCLTNLLPWFAGIVVLPVLLVVALYTSSGVLRLVICASVAGGAIIWYFHPDRFYRRLAQGSTVAATSGLIVRVAGTLTGPDGKFSVELLDFGSVEVVVLYLFAAYCLHLDYRSSLARA